MKPQDLIFLIIIFLTIFIRPIYTWAVAIASLFLAGILFLLGNLYTSQRVSWYATALLFILIIRQTLYWFYHQEPK